MDQNSLTTFTDIAIQIIVPVVTIFATWAAHRLIKVFEAKTGIDVATTQEAQIDLWVRQGVTYATEKAHKALKDKTESITGPAKLEAATGFVLELVKAQGWHTWTKELIEEKIHSVLGEKRDIKPQ